MGDRLCLEEATCNGRWTPKSRVFTSNLEVSGIFIVELVPSTIAILKKTYLHTQNYSIPCVKFVYNTHILQPLCRLCRLDLETIT